MRTLAIVSALLIGGLTSFTSLSAQEVIKEPLPQRGALLDGKTIVKTSPIADILGTYNLSAERILNKRFSVELGLAYTPLSETAFSIQKASNIFQLKFDDYDGKAKGHGLFLAGKYYVSKTGYGHGFYFKAEASYGSNTSYGHQSIELKSGNVATINKVDKESSSTLGIGIGAQWLIGKRRNIVIDWNILNLNRKLSYKDHSTYTLQGKQPFTIEDSKEMHNSIVRNRMHLFALVIHSFLPSPVEDLREPYKSGQSFSRDNAQLSNWDFSTGLSIGFRF